MPKKTTTKLTKAQHIDRITGIIVQYANELRDAVELPDAKAITAESIRALQDFAEAALPNGLEFKVEACKYADHPKPPHALDFEVKVFGKWHRCGDANDYPALSKVVENLRAPFIKVNEKRQKLCVYTDLKTARQLAQQFYVRLLVDGVYTVSEIRRAFQAELKKSCTC